MSTEEESTRALRATLRADLVEAMKARRPDEVAALRTAIAAIDNAEAVEPESAAGFVGSEHVAGAHAGAGSSEAQRRILTLDDVRRILLEQVADRRTEADRYDEHERHEAASGLRRQADVVARYLDTSR